MCEIREHQPRHPENVNIVLLRAAQLHLTVTTIAIELNSLPSAELKPVEDFGKTKETDFFSYRIKLMHLIIVTLILVSVTSGARIRTPSHEAEKINREDLEHFRNDHNKLSTVLQGLQDLDEEIQKLEHESANREVASIEQVMSKIMRDRRGFFDFIKNLKGSVKKLAAEAGKKLVESGLRKLGFGRGETEEYSP